MTRRRSAGILRYRSTADRVLDAGAGYMRTLLDTLSRRVWTAVGAALFVVLIGDALEIRFITWLGFGVLGGFAFMWLAIGTGEHLRNVRDDRRAWRTRET